MKISMKRKSLIIGAEDIIISLYSLNVIVLILSTTQFAEKFSEALGIDFQVCVFAVDMLCVLTIVLLIIAEKKVNKKLICIGVPMLALALVVIMQNGRTAQVAALIAFFVAGGYLKTDKIVQRYVLIASIVVLVTILLQISGVYYFESRFDQKGERLYLGFNSATTCVNYFFYIVLAYFSTRKKITLSETTIVIFLDVLFFYWTKTVAVFAEIILLILILWMTRWFPRLFKGKLFKYVLVLVMPIMAVSSIFLAYTYNPSSKFYFILNTILHNRLWLGNNAIHVIGFSLFGRDVDWKTAINSYFFVDCSYLSIALTFGCVMLVLLVLAYTLFAKKVFDDKRMFFCVAYLILAIRAFTDPQLLDLQYNPMTLLVGSFVFANGLVPTHYESCIKIRKSRHSLSHTISI